MFSIPPAMMISASPKAMALAAMMTVCKLDPQTLFTVTAPTRCGSPAPIAACLAWELAQPGAEHASHQHLVDLFPPSAECVAALGDGDTSQFS